MARDILIVTLCGALWLLALMGADGDWENAQPASTPLVLPKATHDDSAKSTESAKAPPADELPLYLDSKTTATQTKPDDPAKELSSSGVTVAVKSAPRPHMSSADSADKPVKVELLQVSPDKSPAPQVERSPESLTSRQTSLSYGGDETEVSLVDQNTALKRQDTPLQKPTVQPRQFLPRSEPGNRALPPAPVKQQPLLAAQPVTPKVKIETQQIADSGIKHNPVAKPSMTPAAKPQPGNKLAVKPAMNPSTRATSELSHPQVASTKPAIQTAKTTTTAKPSHEAVTKPQAAKPATLNAQAPPVKQKAQLNGGMRIMTPRHNAASETAPAHTTLLSAKPAPAPIHNLEDTSVAANSNPSLPDGEELVTADLMPAQASHQVSRSSETAFAEPSAPLPSAHQSKAQPEPALPADAAGEVVIGTVSTAPSVSPGVVFMALLALALFALWFWLRRRPTPPTPLTLLQQKAVSVIETISLAPGRQIVLVEVSGNALVLGVTPQSINLLERLPLALLAQNYQPTVENIIVRESSQAAQWAEAPRMAAAGGGRPVMPFSQPRVSGTAVRTSLAELRREQATRGQNLSVVGSEADRD